MRYFQLVFVLIGWVILSAALVTAQSGLCFQCEPGEIITTENIAQLQVQAVGESIPISLSFTPDSSQIVLIHSLSTAHLDSGDETRPNFLLIWSKQLIDEEHTVWDISSNFDNNFDLYR